MTFWIIAGLLIAVALLFLGLPLLRGNKFETAAVTQPEANLSVYRDQLRELDADLVAGTLDEKQYQGARSELEGRALEDAGRDHPVSGVWGGRRLAVAAVIAVPLLTVALYLALGKPGGMEPPQQQQAKVAGGGQQQGQVTREQIEAMVAKLAQKLKDKPDDAGGWEMLGRSYATLRRFSESSAAYARAAALAPGNAQLLADYADVLAVTNGKSMQGEPEKIILQALKVDPNNIKALALSGTAAFQRQDFRNAAAQWQKILKLAPPDSPLARSVNANINEAQQRLGKQVSANR